MTFGGYSLNDLPRFSDWPARLLGLQPWDQRCKSPAEVLREYEQEKWGPLLARFGESGRKVSVEDVDEWVLQDVPPSLCSIGDQFELLPARQARRRYVEFVERMLQAQLPAAALVELGAGYGSVILRLARRDCFAGMRFIAGEYTASGSELLRQLSASQNIRLEVGSCDLSTPEVVRFTIPRNALIVTSYAVPYVPLISSDSIKSLASYGPKAVVHIEPCWEHCDAVTLLGLLRRRYIEINGYNTNLVTVLRELENRGMIKIVEETRCAFGINPLLAASVVTWTPA